MSHMPSLLLLFSILTDITTKTSSFVSPDIDRSSQRLPRQLSMASGDDLTKNKTVTFIRHGCTFMNEYLSSNPFGSPEFTDVFNDNKDLYMDSPLSPLGVRQAKALADRLGDSSCPDYGNLIHDVDLIVVSPLTRAIQTLELGILPHFASYEDDNRCDVPIFALPHAAERLYLISDVGKTRQDLHEQYGHAIDFLHDGFDMETWWFQHDDSYVEWRPSSSKQRYACPGEPDDSFDSRMLRLYKWLDDRPEYTIAVVSHWGVIDWFINADFDNCEMKAVPFHDLAALPKVKRLLAQETKCR